MKKLLKDINIELEEPILIYHDNAIIVRMSKNPILHSNTNHISIKYHIVREKLLEKEIRLEYVSVKHQIINFFTKPFPKDTFEYLRAMPGVIPLPTS